MEKLQRDNPGCVRQKRKYTKSNAEFWEKIVFAMRKRPCLDEDHEQ